MAKIAKSIIEKILEAAKIEEVVSDFIDLKKKGVRYLGLCPFHDDRSLGSFVVYPKEKHLKQFSFGYTTNDPSDLSSWNGHNPRYRTPFFFRSMKSLTTSSIFAVSRIFSMIDFAIFAIGFS